MTESLKHDLAYIENKYHKTNEPFNSLARMAYHGWECDPETGYDDACMRKALGVYTDLLINQPHPVQKAKAFAFVLDHMRFTVNEHDYFVCLYNWHRPLNPFTVNKWSSEAMSNVSPESRQFMSEYNKSGDVNIWMDYDHSVPDWHALYAIGIRGILERARVYRSEKEHIAPLTPAQIAYFDAIEIEYSAVLRLIDRLYNYADAQVFEKAPAIARCLKNLRDGAPKTMYDVLQLIYLYFMLSESVDSYQVRSLGSGLDTDLYPYYLADINAGRYTRDQLHDFIGYFLMQYSAIGNYWGQPLYLGGTDINGESKVNELSYILLDIYDKLEIYNPKLQVKYNKKTPEKFLLTILDMIRRGHSSFVLVCEDNIIKGFAQRGIPYEQAFDFDVKGCYEFAVRAGEISTAPFYINLLGSVVRAVNERTDYADYEAYESEYYRQLAYIYESGIKAVNEMERWLGEVNPAPMLSATIQHSLETAQDAYNTGSRYNTTAIVVSGLASAVDALMAVKYLVFDTRTVTLAELKNALDNNWSDEKLRLRALRNPHKYGCGDPEADKCAEKLADFIASWQGRSNVRGGAYKVTIHSARQFIEFGKKTQATPDGRRAGEETSKNASATPGMDTNGVTALINSVHKIRPYRYHEGFGFDVMLHETAVKGEDGLGAMKSLLDAYDAGGGSTIQFNIVDTATLKAAQREPQKYQSLQIRVCGWNVLFNNMSRVEQDKYIERAANLQ